MMKKAGGKAADEAVSKTKEMAVAKADEITGIDVRVACACRPWVEIRTGPS